MHLPVANMDTRQISITFVAIAHAQGIQAEQRADGVHQHEDTCDLRSFELSGSGSRYHSGGSDPGANSAAERAKQTASETARCIDGAIVYPAMLD